MQTVEYHIKLPKHLSVRLEDQIIERYGYKARGGITLLILEALEEKLNPNKSKLKSEKNELALKSLGDERVNRNLNVASEISIILPDIKTHMQPSGDNEDAYYITHSNLVKILTRKLGITEKRGHKNKIHWMTSIGLLTLYQEYKSVGYGRDGKPNPPILVNNYLVSPEFLAEEKKALT